MKNRKLNKKGMTIVEVVIAMVVVTMVTIAAVTIILSSTHTTNSAVYKNQAQYFASDALACFRASSDAQQFEDAMAFRGGYSEHSVSENQYTFLLNDSKYVAVATVIYPIDGRPSFTIEVMNPNGDVVASIPTFTKGG